MLFYWFSLMSKWGSSLWYFDWKDWRDWKRL